MKNIIPVIALSFLVFSCTKEQKTDKVSDKASKTAVSGTANTAKSGETGALNPEHGKPGHRCDIAVGAPLNGTPAQSVSATNQGAFSGFDTSPMKTAAPAPVKQPVPVSNQQSVNIVPQQTTVKPTTTGKTAPGMNPAHGEPGHRCDIAVGAPLSSPKAQTSAVTPQPTPSPVPAQNAVASGEKPAKNPAHGAPFHRCDLQVGDPLP
ncbi:MAG: hypothetical protein K0M56_09535 [Kaistella sp.]|nr:hypothetical protein [Kaistella sp.]